MTKHFAAAVRFRASGGMWALALWVLAVTPGLLAAADSVPVHIEGRRLVVNGQGRVPEGLFGVHAVPVNAETVADLGIECTRQIHFFPTGKPLVIDNGGQLRPVLKDLPVMIDCMGDRYAPATVLTDPNYERTFRSLAREYARWCRQTGYAGKVEFWNEPYLNWAERSRGERRNSYWPDYYDTSKAVEGGPVTIKGWDKPLTHMRWRQDWVRTLDREGVDKNGKPRQIKGKIHPGMRVPEGLKPGDRFKAKSPPGWYWWGSGEWEFEVVKEWHPYDPTAVSWWSGRQNLEFYLWMFLPYAEELKKAGPELTLIAGWDWGFSHGDWAVWRELVQPLIDQAPQWIDGISEHHYGVNPREVPVWYEVLAQYGMTRHQRWIKGYNTECDGTLDPAVHGLDALADQPADQLLKDAGNATYHLRDIVGLASMSPDKVGSRTAHGFGMRSGTAQVLRLLKPLRGELLRCRSGDLDVWPVASVRGDQLVIVVFNNSSESRVIDWTIDAPAGTRLGEGELAWIEADVAAGELRIGAEPLRAGGTQHRFTRSLGGQQALRLVLPLHGKPTAQAPIQRRQFFSTGGVLTRVKPGDTVAMPVAIDPRHLAAAERAILRLALENASFGQVRLTLNGQSVTVPARDHLMEIPLDASGLKAVNDLRFSVQGSDGRAFQINALSIVLDGPAH